MTYAPPTHSYFNPYTKCPACGTKIWSDHKKMREWGSMKLHDCMLYRTRRKYYYSKPYSRNKNDNNKYSNRRY